MHAAAYAADIPEDAIIHPEQGPPPGIAPLHFAWRVLGALKLRQDNLEERIAFLEAKNGIRLLSEGDHARTTDAPDGDANPGDSDSILA